MATVRPSLWVLFGWVFATCGAFVIPIPSTSRFSTGVESSISTAIRASSSASPEFFLLSFDGTVAKTTEWRISQGIEVAFSVWPHLKDSCVIVEDDEWLRNKMRAVSSVLVCRPGCSLSVDYALLARLLIEEQALDKGRSNGSSGKYGSKFHPRTASTRSSPRGGRSSRPLTVGEIAENWNKGGCLAETVLTKYHIDYKNPLPVLQGKVEEWNEDSHYDPDINYAVIDALKDSASNIIVTLGHESDLPTAKRAIESIGVRTAVLCPQGDKLCISSNAVDDQRRIKLLAVPSNHGATYRDVLTNAPDQSTVYIFESSWPALEQGIDLFGDNIPQVGAGLAETVVGRDIKLSLNFPKWSTSALATGQKSQGDVTQQNEAIMNAWTNLVGERDFSELLSARIVPSSISSSP